MTLLSFQAMETLAHSIAGFKQLSNYSSRREIAVINDAPTIQSL